MLYIITDGEHFKFGISRNVVDRMATLQTGNPRAMSIVAVIDTPITNENLDEQDQDLEADLHAFLWQDRISGEWFNGTAARVKAVVELIKGRHYIDVMSMMAAEVHHILNLPFSAFTDAACWDRWRYRKRHGAVREMP